MKKNVRALLRKCVKCLSKKDREKDKKSNQRIRSWRITFRI
jgi:hypothetical protein